MTESVENFQKKLKKVLKILKAQNKAISITFFLEIWKMPGSGPPPTNVEFSTFFFLTGSLNKPKHID